MLFRPVALILILWPSLSLAEATSPAPSIQFNFSDADLADDGHEDSLEGQGPFSPVRRFELGFDSRGDRQAAYASAGLVFDFGSLDVGRPRSVLDQGLVDARPGSDDGLRPLASEAALDERLGAGVALNAHSGTFSLGTSLHRTEEDASVSIIGLAGRVDLPVLPGLDRMALYGGAETDGVSDRLRLGTEFTRGRTVLGLDVLTERGDDGFSLGQVYVGVNATPDVTVGVSGARRLNAGDAGGDVTRFGFGATYDTGEGAFLRGGIADATGEDPAFDFSVGFQF